MLRRHLRISWMQRLQDPGTGVKVVFEQTVNYNTTQGAFLQTVNSGLGGSNPATQGYLSVRGASGNTSDLYTHALGANPGVWQSFSAEIDLDAATVGGVVKIFDGNGTETGSNRDLNPGAASFVNDVLYIGGRSSGAAIGFVGNIDELKIEDVPEPATSLLASLGLIVVGFRRRRN